MESTDKSEETQPTEAANGRAELSERERGILVLVATGLSNKEIAQRLVISPNTVKVHLRNIFAKIDVSSRTEAALFAIREGWVQGMGETTEAGVGANAARPDDPAPTLPVLAAPAVLPTRRRNWLAWGLVLAVAILAGVSILIYFRIQPASVPQPTLVPATAIPRWTVQADMPTARSGLAVVGYDNKIYAIGGETAGGVTGALERFEPTTGAWTTLEPKPVAVADAGAVAIGGEIFVPGGRLASGAVSDRLDVYDPDLDHWESRAPLPIPLSGYALVAFEGRLFVFGGWDGKRYVASTFRYDPGEDVWTEMSPMLTARGFAGAAVAGDRVYVMGGLDDQMTLAVNEEYRPNKDRNNEVAWIERSPLSPERAKFGIASVADSIYVLGGVVTPASGVLPTRYLIASDLWQTFDYPDDGLWTGMGLAVLDTHLYAIGGSSGAQVLSRNMAYKALFSVSIPEVP